MNANYGWIITRDLLSEKYGDGPVNVGVQGPRNSPFPGDHFSRKSIRFKKFRLLDDDGEVYYEGLIDRLDHDDDDCLFGPLDDFGGPNDGCSTIQYKNGRKWETL